MASQFALLFVRKLKVPVLITDLDQARVDKGVAYIHDEIGKLEAKGRLDGDAANQLRALVTGTTDKSLYADCDFVIEAVFEEMSVKKTVWAEVEAIVSPECVLASNTSSLSITEMASELQNPERVVGFHFFNPVAVMPLLEIIPGEKTDDAALVIPVFLAAGYHVRRDIPAHVEGDGVVALWRAAGFDLQGVRIDPGLVGEDGGLDVSGALLGGPAGGRFPGQVGDAVVHDAGLYVGIGV